LAHPNAVFTASYSRIGASPDGGMSYHLVRQAGLRRAMELYLTNRILTAQEAVEWGVVNRVLPAEGFLAEARKHAMELAQGPTLAFVRAKELFQDSLQNGMETQLEREAVRIVASAATEDFQNGVKAFVEKKAPTFKGK
ncbi:MAG: enoyl-CoA hydratase-related protein, partial [Deltaproteobacteria bacterium]|nr:enoyl-CoA hydratase-related protein [Deltaproteobacteria bacterium]